MPTEILHYSEGKAKAFTKLFSQKPNLVFKGETRVTYFAFSNFKLQNPVLVNNSNMLFVGFIRFVWVNYQL